MSMEFVILVALLVSVKKSNHATVLYHVTKFYCLSDFYDFIDYVQRTCISRQPGEAS